MKTIRSGGKNFVRILARISIYYLVLLVAVGAVFFTNESMLEFLPVGTGSNLFSTPSYEVPTESFHTGRLEGTSGGSKTLFVFLCYISSVLLSLPLAWVFLASKERKRSDAGIALAIVVLPIAVTGMVLIVQNSLALAFSIAGIVAGSGLRFRANVKEVSDSLFFLVSIGVGLASGVGALGIAFLMSAIFCYATLVLSLPMFGLQVDDETMVRKTSRTCGIEVL